MARMAIGVTCRLAGGALAAGGCGENKPAIAIIARRPFVSSDSCAQFQNQNLLVGEGSSEGKRVYGQLGGGDG